MVLAVGYAASAVGPIIAGVVRDVTGSFDATLLLLPAIGVTMISLAAIAPELSSE
jgi:cyanate permease